MPSEDPLVNGVFAVEFTRGMQVRLGWGFVCRACRPHTSPRQEGEDPRYLLAATTLKHFAAYSLVRAPLYHGIARSHYARTFPSPHSTGGLPRASNCKTTQ